MKIPEDIKSGDNLLDCTPSRLEAGSLSCDSPLPSNINPLTIPHSSTSAFQKEESLKWKLKC
jgi:hypothetical protein